MKRVRVFALVPDYSLPCLNFLRVKVLPNYSEIDLLMPYNINNSLIFILSFFVKQIRERKRNLELVKINTLHDIKLFYPNIFVVVYYLVTHRLKEKKEFKYYNTLRWIQENYSLKSFKKNNYQIVYGFDTAADKVFKCFLNSEKYLESRGCYINYVLQKNVFINEFYNSNLQINDKKNEWFEKMQSEVKNANVIVGYSDFHIEQFHLDNMNAKYLKYKIPSKFEKSNEVKSVISQINFCFIGSLVIEKGVLMLLDIWQIIQSEFVEIKHKLVLIGPCNDSRILKKIKNTPNVIYLGKLSTFELSDYLKKEIHVLVAPTHYDSFGMIINEATSMNIPIITSKHCGASELLNENVASVIDDSFNRSSWIETISDHIKNPIQIEEKSKNLLLFKM